MFWVYLLAKTYDRHEVAKKLVALLKIVLFRSENDTVLTGTNDASSHPNEHDKPPVHKHKAILKGSKLKKNESIREVPEKLSKRTTRKFLKDSWVYFFLIFYRSNFDNHKNYNNTRKKRKNETKFKKFEEPMSYRNDSTVRGHESKRSSVDIIYVANSKNF